MRLSSGEKFSIGNQLNLVDILIRRAEVEGNWVCQCAILIVGLEYDRHVQASLRICAGMGMRVSVAMSMAVAVCISNSLDRVKGLKHAVSMRVTVALKPQGGG